MAAPDARLITAIDFAAGYRAAVAKLMHNRDDEVTTLEDLLVRPAWMADAACREHPEVNFFPDRGDDVRPAKAICAGCLVRDECLAEAFAQGDQAEVGIWGGLSAKQRRTMRRVRPNSRHRTSPITLEQHRDLLAFVHEHHGHSRAERLRLWNDQHPERVLATVESLNAAVNTARHAVKAEADAPEPDSLRREAAVDQLAARITASALRAGGEPGAA